MIPRYKNKAVVGLIVGVTLFLGGWAVLVLWGRGPTPRPPRAPMVMALTMILVSVPFYLWGCAALAKAKGYSSAILLTCFCGWLFPAVVLLVLPDKNKQHRRRW